MHNHELPPTFPPLTSPYPGARHNCVCEFCLLTHTVRDAFQNTRIAGGSFGNAFDTAQRNLGGRIAQLEHELSEARMKISAMMMTKIETDRATKAAKAKVRRAAKARSKRSAKR